MENFALSELYETYGYYVHRRCLALLRSTSDADDDACQEVFLRAAKYHRGQVGDSVLAWLYTIAVRCSYHRGWHRLPVQSSSQPRHTVSTLWFKGPVTLTVNHVGPVVGERYGGFTWATSAYRRSLTIR